MTYDNINAAIYEHNALLTTLPAAQGGNGGPVQSFQQNVAHKVKRKRRSVQSLLEPPLFENISDSTVLVFKALDEAQDLFETNKLKAICSMDTDIVRLGPSFESVCLRPYRAGKCSSSWSLGNYVALLNDHKSCQDITDEDVKRVKDLLKNCSSYFVKQTLKAECKYPDVSMNITSNCPSVPPDCIKHTAVYNIFQYLVDNEFMVASDVLKYTLSIPPVFWRANFFYEEIYEKLKDNNPVKDGVELAAFRFGNFKFDKFSTELIAEVIFPALAMIIVFCIMWFFLGSFVLTFCGLFCIIYACGLSYFLYKIVFGMDFFSFPKCAYSGILGGYWGR